MEHIPSEDLPGIYLGIFLLLLLLVTWVPYMIRSIRIEKQEEREQQMLKTSSK